MSYKKIAAQAGVSPATVTKVFKGSAEISRETVEHVMRVARENDLLPPRYTKTRKERSAPNRPRVAVLVPEIVSIYYAQIVSKAVAVLRAEGADAEIHIISFDEEEIRPVLDRITEDGLVDGVLIVGGIKTLHFDSLPAVCFSESENPRSSGMSFCCVSALHYIDDCIRYLRSLGHETVGYVGEQLTTMKHEYFVQCAREQGMICREEHCYITDARFEEAGREAALAVIARREQGLEGEPTAYLCGYDEIALGFIATLVQHGVRVPEDISVIGINNIPAAEHGVVRLTSVDTFPAERIAFCVHMLLDKIASSPQRMPDKVYYEGELIIRASTGEAPKTIHTAKK